MDLENVAIDHRRMPMGTTRNDGRQRRRRKRSSALFLGPWLLALGRKPREVANATGINEGYISQLINGKKENPSRDIRDEIADFLGIPGHYLERPPPEKEVVAEIRALDPALIERLHKS